ncbi:MAG TPA: methyltransferase domain-containing protein [Candidatus Binataceae bacterium]|nr:methyltransferase domain-containing protein [Candidatus Binataceae bacterium]
MKRLFEPIRKMIPSRLKQVVRQKLGLPTAVGARWRMANGVEPLSYEWGGDRGNALFAVYVGEFLTEFREDIRGHCLEFNNDAYTSAFGGSQVEKLDILHQDNSNPQATIWGDLTRENNLPSDTFDCIICTHVLHLIFEVWKAVPEIYRMLKPGGVLLVAVPQVSMCDPSWGECYRYTEEGLRRMLGLAFREGDVLVKAYGNSLISAGQIRGLTAEEFTPEEMNYHDPRFGVEVCARAVKGG